MALSPASYTNGHPGPGARRPASGRLTKLFQQSRQLLSLSSTEAAAKMRLDGCRVDGPHAAAQGSSLGGEQKHVVATIALALLAPHQTRALQPVEEAAQRVLGELGPRLHVHLAQHALGRARDLVQHVVTIERRQTGPLQPRLDLVDQGALGAQQAEPSLDDFCWRPSVTINSKRGALPWHFASYMHMQ